MRSKPVLFEIDDYVARGEAKAVFTDRRRIEGFECCICPEVGGKRHSPAEALRHFKTDRHRRARTRRRFALDGQHAADASVVLGDTTSFQAIDGVDGTREDFPESGFDAETASQADQLFDFDVDVDEPAGHSLPMTPRLFEGYDLHDDVEFGERVDRFFTDNLGFDDYDSFNDLEVDDHSQNAMASSAPLFDVLDVFKEYSNTVRSRTSSIPDPTNAWYPFPGPMMCVLATFYQSPQERLSKKNLGRILSLLHVFGLKPPLSRSSTNFSTILPRRSRFSRQNFITFQMVARYYTFLPVTLLKLLSPAPPCQIH